MAPPRTRSVPHVATTSSSVAVRRAEGSPREREAGHEPLARMGEYQVQSSQYACAGVAPYRKKCHGTPQQFNSNRDPQIQVYTQSDSCQRQAYLRFTHQAAFPIHIFIQLGNQPGRKRTCPLVSHTRMHAHNAQFFMFQRLSRFCLSDPAFLLHLSFRRLMFKFHFLFTFF